MRDFRNLEELPHHGVVAGVLEGRIVIIFDEIEKGTEIGVAGVFGELFIAFCQLSKEAKDFIGRQGLHFSVFEFLAEFRDGGMVGSAGIFFSNGVCGTRANSRLLGRLS